MDLSVFRFDYDLTFAALLMNADGTIYHTYGGRDRTDPMSHLALPAFVDVLRATLAEHEAYRKDPRPPKLRPKRTIEEIPRWAREIARGKPPKCYHCHMVYEGEIQHLYEQRRWTRDKAWLWPDPIQVGLRLDKVHQTRVAAVEPGSAAAKAGLSAGDRLVRLGGARPRTFGDVQRVLHEAPAGPTKIDVAWEGGSGRLELGKGWKEATPLTYAWRASKWPLSPKPGFGGRPLTPDQLAARGLPRDGFAFRVDYIVTWGPNAHTGRTAAAAGIRKGDVVTSFAGKSDFEDMDHFHAWVRLTRRAGETVEIHILRNDERKVLKLKLVE